jgi:dihydrofolate synthase/folylpolyglutamate synthase
MRKDAMTLDAAEAKIYLTGGGVRGESRLGLARTRALLRKLGNPERKLRFVHVAGTNGKGSISAMIASALAEAGCLTGLYTSPYIHDFNERICVNGVPIEDASLAELTECVRFHADAMSDRPTEFEMITALAFQYFFDKACDVVVLEVGLGGRLDATNVIETPELAVISKIAMDHTAELGVSLERIAREKAGVIKSGGLVVSSPQDETAARVIRNKCLAEDARPGFVDEGDIELLARTLDGQRFRFGDEKDYEIPLHGDHQLINAATAILALENLRGRGFDIPDSAIRSGLRNVCWPGRFEILRREPFFIVDGAHNPDGVRAAVSAFARLFPGKKATFLFGVLADKDYLGMIKILLPAAKRFFVVPPENPKALPSAELVARIRMTAGSYSATVCETVEAGVNAVLNEARKDDVIIALGSLYMVGAVRNCFE